MIDEPDSEANFGGVLTGGVQAPPPRRRLMWSAIACIVAAYLLTVTGKWRPTPDSSLYLGLGRSLAEQGTYLFNGEINSFVSPGLPLILAGLYKLGVPGYWLENLFVALCAVGTLWLAYVVFARISDKRMAMAVVACTAASYTFFFNSHRILTDLPSALLFFVSFYGCLRADEGSAWWMLPVILAVAVGTIIRVPHVLVVGAMAVGLAINKPMFGRAGKRLLYGGAILVVSGALLAIFYALARICGDKPPAYMTRLPGRGAPSIFAAILTILKATVQMPDALAEAVTSRSIVVVTEAAGAAVVILTVIGLVVIWKQGRRLIPTTCVLFPLSLAVLGSFKPHSTRYLLPVLPLMIYAALVGLRRTVRRIRRRRGLPTGPAELTKAITVFTIVIVMCNGPYLAVHGFYYTYAAYTDRYYDIIVRGENSDYFTVAEILRMQCPADTPVGCAGATRIPHYLSRRKIVSFDRKRYYTRDYATVIVERIRSRKQRRLEELGFVMVDKHRSSWQFLEQFRSEMAPMPYKVIYEGKRYLLYRSDSLPGTGNRRGPARQLSSLPPGPGEAPVVLGDARMISPDVFDQALAFPEEPLPVGTPGGQARPPVLCFRTPVDRMDQQLQSGRDVIVVAGQ